MMAVPELESGRLQAVFDERVSAALAQMGIPTRKDMEALNQKVDRLIAAPRGRKAPNKTTAGKRAAKRKA